jgi:hypothetical protein
VVDVIASVAPRFGWPSAWHPGRTFLLVGLGLASLLPYVAALGLGDLREHTAQFVVSYLAAFALYLAACALVLQPGPQFARTRLAVIAVFALLYRLILLPTPPTLSDDMFRYVWDGRVQGHGYNPYRHPPSARELAALRQPPVYQTLWRHINRKDAVTVYPPGAQLTFAGLWRLVGDSVTGFKAALVLAETAGAVVVLGLLRAFQLPPERVLIYLWSPLLVFEVAQAGHVDGLMLPLLAAACLARVRERPAWVGVFLGAATLVKLFPALLLPALLPLPARWSWQGLRPAALTLAAFAGVIAAAYLPYGLGNAGGVLGFLPSYFSENFNLGLARLAFALADAQNWPRATTANAITFVGLAAISLAGLLKPAVDGRGALLRCLWLIGWFTLTTQNLFPWYLLWLLPLLAVLVEPGRLLGFQLTPALAGLVFTGTVALAYLFFIRWRVVDWAQAAEFGPLYALLLAALALKLGRRRRTGLNEPLPV